MNSQVLPLPTKTLLDSLASGDFPQDTYLGGGTAIALWLGHRKSRDLDWFTPHEFDESMWQMKWESGHGFKLLSRDWQTLEGYIGGAKMALFHYKYPLTGAFGEYRGLKIAGLEDLAAMKLETIISRSTKRDFVDLYFLAKKFGLDKLFDYYDQKFGLLEERELMLKKALVYFSDAEDDEMPDMVDPLKWDEVKRYFLKSVI